MPKEAIRNFRFLHGAEQISKNVQLVVAIHTKIDKIITVQKLNLLGKRKELFI